jgi:SAM-dependent methyltransferase
VTITDRYPELGVGWRFASIDGGPEIPSSVGDAETEELVRLTKGRVVLEIGSAFGYSAIAMARGGANYVLSVDPHIMSQSSLAEMHANVKAYGVGDRVGIVVARSREIMSTLVACNARVDAVFVDGDHSASAVRADTACARVLLAHDGILICHDYGYGSWPGVKVALDELGPPDGLVGSLWSKACGVPVNTLG